MTNALSSAEDCDARVRELYGEDLSGAGGVIHVAALWRAGPDALVTIRPGPAAPRSATDAFVLDLARARADVIVTTGENVRAEPRLRHAPAPERAGALSVWRRERLGKHEAPRSVVLTRRGDLDPAHPLLADGALRLATASLRDALEQLRSEHGARDILIEAGPSTALELYGDPLQVDELMLSIYGEPSLAAAARGREFLSPERLAALLPVASPERRIQEESGRWTFSRRLRESVGRPVLG